MTLDQAITDLSSQYQVKRRLGNDYQMNALLIAIEAIQLVAKRRRFSIPDAADLLPHETK